MTVSTRSSGKSECVNYTTRLVVKLKTEAKERERDEKRQQTAQRERDRELHKEVSIRVITCICHTFYDTHILHDACIDIKTITYPRE